MSSTLRAANLIGDRQQYSSGRNQGSVAPLRGFVVHGLDPQQP
jgi:hypothetical protein